MFLQGPDRSAGSSNPQWAKSKYVVGRSELLEGATLEGRLAW